MRRKLKLVCGSEVQDREGNGVWVHSYSRLLSSGPWLASSSRGAGVELSSAERPCDFFRLTDWIVRYVSLRWCNLSATVVVARNHSCSAFSLAML